MNEHRKLPRRRHSAQFKHEVLAACNEPGASVAGVALTFSLNANWCASGAVFSDSNQPVAP